jgi:hypothetical protein
MAGLNAQSKGRRLGIFKPHEEKPAQVRTKQRGEQFLVELLGGALPATTTDERVRAVNRSRPIDPDRVRSYLEDKFGDDSAALRAALKKLAVAYKPQELADHAFALYELDGSIEALVAAQPFGSVEVEEFYLERTPKTHGYLYRGIAAK